MWEPLYAKEVELAADREDLGPPLDPEEREIAHALESEPHADELVYDHD
jgi:hypothetical protein